MRDGGIFEANELPSGWTVAPLSSVALVNPVISREIGNETLVSFVPMVAVEAMTGVLDPSIVRRYADVKKGFTRFQDGDVVFAKITPSMENGKIALAKRLRGGIGCGTTELHVIRPLDGVEPGYLLFFFLQSSFRQDAQRNMKGTAGQLRVPAEYLKQALIPIAPAAEQRRIVAKIDELFSDIDEGERCLARAEALLKQYRQSVLKAAVTGELTRDWRAKNAGKGETGAELLQRILKARREAWEAAELAKMQTKGKPHKDDSWKRKYVEPAPPGSSNLPELPQRWVWASIDQLVSDFRNGLSKKPNEAPPGAPIFRISAVRPFHVDETDLRFYPEDGDEELFSYWVERDDLLFTRYNGSRRLVGVCGRYVGSKPILHPDKLMKARVPDRGLISPTYLELAANTWITREFIDLRIKTTAGQHGISGTDVKAAPIPLPPIQEQQAVVEAATSALGVSDITTGAIIAEHQRAALGLRQSILRAAFSGRLVPQDSTDEPASVLLERISAERVKQVSRRERRGSKARSAAVEA